MADATYLGAYRVGMADDGAVVGTEEAALVARAVGDRRAFAPLYARYLDPVHRYCHRRLGTREAAEDATSLVFAKALAALPTFRGGSFRAWLFAIAHRVVVDEYRSTRPDRTMETAAGVPDPAPTPEEVALAGEGERDVRRLLASLATEQRHVIELRLAGLNGREIADVLGRSHAWVRTTQVRALARLRTLAGESAEREGAGDG
jgi:RNA polymerase sigma-70 factor (ECF subfamily)